MTDVRLSQDDKDALLEFLDSYTEKVSPKDIDEIEHKLSKKIIHIKHQKKLPSFVEPMLEQAETMVPLVFSTNIDERKRNRVIAALHYFIWSEDRIPDYLPVIGYLDDAFIIRTVYKDVKREILKIEEKDVRGE